METFAPSQLSRFGVGLTLAFIYIPLIVILIYAFNAGKTPNGRRTASPSTGSARRSRNSGARDAFVTSIKAACAATAIAIVLGTLASLAVSATASSAARRSRSSSRSRSRSRGSSPGSRSTTPSPRSSASTSLFTVIVGHATFCIVLVYNNVVARLRRVSTSLEEASADLGADTWQTFRLVTFPSLRSALVAGALLAFALSFDEIIVTRFTIGADIETLPIWIYNNLFRSNQLPIVNVVAVIVILIS